MKPMARRNLMMLALAAAVAAPGAAYAQLPGVGGLPSVGLPGIGLPSPQVRPPARTPAPAPRVRPAAPDVPAQDEAIPTLAPPPAAGGGSTPEAPLSAEGLLEAVPVGAGFADPPTAAAAPGAGGATDVILRAGEGVAGAVEETLATAESYRSRARALLSRHGDVLEADARGRPVVRGEVVAIGVTPRALGRAMAAGFRVQRRETIAGLDLPVAVLVAPRRLSAEGALARLRALDPAGLYDLNHIYLEGGSAAGPGGAAARGARSGRGLRIGLVDGTADRRQPALAGAPMVQKAFAPGGAQVTAHATAVASLLAGADGAFQGAAPGATLYVADVYGPTPVGGSALAIARALGWLAEEGTPVVNISLVGPPNAVLEAGVKRLVARGHVVVAAVGNDGPAAEPLYPAAYPGVVAVTGVDARRRALPEAGRGPHVDFAAPGAEIVAAGLGGGLVGVRGTSFAAPLAAGRLAHMIASPDPAAADRAVAALAKEAADLGPRGRDPLYGHGLVAFDLAVRAASQSARAPAR